MWMLLLAIVMYLICHFSIIIFFFVKKKVRIFFLKKKMMEEIHPATHRTNPTTQKMDDKFHYIFLFFKNANMAYGTRDNH
jgi:hypothetical protein